jgi:soluble lytic murein transglycosylase
VKSSVRSLFRRVLFGVLGFLAVSGSASPLGPATPGDLWIVPDESVVAAHALLARGVADYEARRLGDAARVFAAAERDPEIGQYATLYLLKTHLAASKTTEANATAQRLLGTSLSGYLAEAALGFAADAAIAAGDTRRAFVLLQRLAALPVQTAPLPNRLRYGRAAMDAGERQAAIGVLTELYLDHAATSAGLEAARRLAQLGALPIQPTASLQPRLLSRAEALFAARQFTDARAALEHARALASADDRRLIELRLIEIDYQLGRFAPAQKALAAYVTKYRGAGQSASAPEDPLVAEAEYYLASSWRELKKPADYTAAARRFADRGGDSPWVERALNELGTHYILANDDATAAAVFDEQYRRFPTGAFAERAAWKAGWWAYRIGNHARAIEIFESAATNLRRADFRPAWLYWAARAHAQLGRAQAALDGYARAIADYRNSYYGRNSIREAEKIQAVLRPAGAGPVSPASLVLPASIAPGVRPPNAGLIESLMAAGMFEEAIGELRHVQAAQGTSPLLEASIALALNRQGLLRSGITAMRRAYPQFMAAGGEALPAELLQVIFPVDYWPLIREHAEEKEIDPFTVAALIAQESTFQAHVRSPANAYGLMQIVPATGRRYALRLGIKPYSTSRLTDPQVNVHIGTTYFSELVRRFGDVAPALAGYNAGEGRAAQWLAERPDLPRDEWIDDIPYPETQHYVKRVIGTSEDYRRIYGR